MRQVFITEKLLKTNLLLIGGVSETQERKTGRQKRLPASDLWVWGRGGRSRIFRSQNGLASLPSAAGTTATMKTRTRCLLSLL